MTDVVLIGEAMGMFSANENGGLLEGKNFSKGVAGAEVNVGIGLTRLGFDVNFLTKLGTDPFGEYIYDYLKKENIGTKYITFDKDNNTGLMLKSKIEKGDPQTSYYRKDSAFSTFSIEDVINKIDFNEVRLLHVTGIPAALNEVTRGAIYYLMAQAKEAGTFITFDPNLRPALWKDEKTMILVMNDLAKYANVVLPGIAEGEILTGSKDKEEIADFYLNLGVDYVVIKTGEEGAFIKKNDNSIIQVPGFKVNKVVDTVGAGDGFAVGIISGYLDGLDVKEAAERANAIGAIQVQNQSDNEGLPTYNELDRYIKENRNKQGMSQ